MTPLEIDQWFALQPETIRMLIGFALAAPGLLYFSAIFLLSRSRNGS